MATVVIGFVILHIVHFLLQKTSNERPLKLKIAHLEQKLFVAQNEAKIIKREMDQLRSEKCPEHHGKKGADVVKRTLVFLYRLRDVINICSQSVHSESKVIRARSL